jgi:hypothetical protein
MPLHEVDNQQMQQMVKTLNIKPNTVTGKTRLTPGSRVLLEKLTVTQLIKKFTAFMEPDDSLPCSQEPVNGPYPKPDETSPLLPILFP